MTTYGDKIKKLVDEWKQTSTREISPGFTVQNAVLTEYKMEKFVYERAIEEIENDKS